jgi:hypothetical protein
VTGAEFKQVISDSRKQPPANSLNWLYAYKNEWGNNAWVVDGWAGKAEKLSAFPIVLSSEKCESFRRNWKSTSRSEWDLTIAQMVDRVSKAYGI